MFAWCRCCFFSHSLNLPLSTTISFLCSLPSFQLFHTENARLSTCSIFLPCPEPLNKISFCCKSFIVFDSVWEILYALTFSSSTCISVVVIVVFHCTALHCTTIVCLCLYFFLTFLPPLSFFDLYDFIFLLVYFVFVLFFFAYYSHQPISHQLHFAAR